MNETRQMPWDPDEELATGSGQSLHTKLGISYENPDQVVRKKGLAVFESMERKDGHYAAVLQTRKLMLLGKGYEIQPASDAPKDQEVAEFVRWNLTQMKGSFVQDVYEILDALGKGFSLTEMNYTLAERGPYAGKVILKSLKAKEQNRFGFAVDDFDNVLDDGVVQNPLVSHGLRLANVMSDVSVNALQGRTGDGFNVRLPRAKFIHFIFNGRAENPYGRGLGSVCYWYSWFKTEGGFKFWLVFLERFGSPTAKLTVTKEASDEDKRKARQILKALQQETGVIVPEGMELAFLEAMRAGAAGYDKLIEVCNAEISKIVLGQTLTTEQGDRGARSLGEVHQETLFHILKFDAELLCAALSEQLIRTLVDFNYLVEEYPTYDIPLKPRRDLGAASQALQTLVGLGAQVPERHVHEEYGLPVPAEGEPVLRAPSASKAPESPVEPFAERPLSRTQIEPPDLKRREQEAQDGLIEAGVLRGQRLVADILEDLIDQVRKSGAIAQRNYRPELTVRIRPFRDALTRTAVLAYLTAQQIAVDELERKGVTFPQARFAAFAEDDDGPEILGPEDAIKLFRDRLPITKQEFNRLVAQMRSKYFTVAGIEEQQLLRIVQEALIEAIENGTTVETFALAVRERGVRYTGRAFGRDLAGQPLLDHHMRLIFRNNVLSAYSQGREALFNDPDVAGFIPFMMYSAIDDDRVRDSHRAMDGRIYRKDDPIWLTWTPPNGHNCRCKKIPVTQPEARRLSEDQVVTGPAVVAGKAATPDKGFGGIL